MQLTTSIIPINYLSNDEESVLFLIMHGYSFKEISIYLNLPSFNIKHKIVEKLFQKFDIKSKSKKDLFIKAISMGYSLVIPEKLLPKKVIAKRIRNVNLYS